MIRHFIKERLAAVSSSLSGVLGFLGGYQVCHNICMGLIAVLALLGITVVGMPLLFLTKVAIPFWILAVVLFLTTLTLYFKKKCISRNTLMLNAGIIIAGVPFTAAKPALPFLWIIGGTLAIISISLLVKEKIHRRHYA